MSRPKVLVMNSNIPEIAFKILSEHCDVIANKDLTKHSVLSKVKGVDGIFYRYPVRLDKDVINAAGPNLKVVGCMATGIDFVDYKELIKRGIKVSNTSGASNDAVANMAVTLLLAASRRIHEARLKIEQNDSKSDYHRWTRGKDITGSTVGIVGLGGIGQTIIKRLRGFEIKEFLYTGRKDKKEGRDFGMKFLPLNALLNESDYVIMSCPLTTETREMCNDDFFSKMKEDSVFVNIARGGLVETDALVRALKINKLFGVGLDVTVPEPLPPDHELLKFPNVVVTPHIGAQLDSCQEKMAELTALNILRGLRGEELLTPIDL